MPTYEYKCSKGHLSEVLCPLAERLDNIVCKHKKCRCVAKRIPTTGSFKINGFNEGNGYS